MTKKYDEFGIRIYDEDEAMFKCRECGHELHLMKLQWDGGFQWQKPNFCECCGAHHRDNFKQIPANGEDNENI